MKIYDHCLFFRTKGLQLTFSVCLSMLCGMGYFTIDLLEKAGWYNLLFSFLKGIFLIGAAYTLLYSVDLSKKITAKFYKK